MPRLRNRTLVWPVACALGVLTTVTVAVVTATTEVPAGEAVVAGAFLFTYVPLTAWGIARSGQRRLCTRRWTWRCRGDHGFERRIAVGLVVLTGALTFAAVAGGAWVGAVSFVMLPLGFLVLASGYRTRAAWQAEVARLRAPAKRRLRR